MNDVREAAERLARSIFSDNRISLHRPLYTGMSPGRDYAEARKVAVEHIEMFLNAEHPPDDDLPELTDEERDALDGMDMTNVLGTWEERHATVMRAAKRLLRENRKLRQLLADYHCLNKCKLQEHNGGSVDGQGRANDEI